MQRPGRVAGASMPSLVGVGAGPCATCRGHVSRSRVAVTCHGHVSRPPCHRATASVEKGGRAEQAAHASTALLAPSVLAAWDPKYADRLQSAPQTFPERVKERERVRMEAARVCRAADAGPCLLGHGRWVPPHLTGGGAAAALLA